MSQSQPLSSQKSQQEITWKLKGGNMTVINHWKRKASDLYMTIKLEFKFDNDPRPHYVGMLSFVYFQF